MNITPRYDYCETCEEWQDDVVDTVRVEEHRFGGYPTCLTCISVLSAYFSTDVWLERREHTFSLTDKFSPGPA